MRMPLGAIVSSDKIAVKSFLIEPLKEGYFSRALVFSQVSAELPETFLF